MATKTITEALACQGVVVDELSDFDNKINKLACFTTRKSGVGNKGVNFLSLRRQYSPLISVIPSIMKMWGLN